MPQYRQCLYDTLALSASANITHQIFNVQENADASHTSDITNMKGAGSLPDRDSMSVDRVGVSLIVATADDDVRLFWQQSFIRIRVAQLQVLQVPTILCARGDAYSGLNNQAVAADMNAFGIMGTGYQLDVPIEFPGGTQLTVELVQTKALTAGCITLVTLDGIYSTP